MKKSCLTVAILATLSCSAVAYEDESNWMFKTGIAQVEPNDDSGTVLGGGVGVDSDTGLGISFTTMLNDNWGVEVLGALPFTHTIVGTGGLAGVEIGETKHLPPTVSMIYQWGNDTKFHVGAGINYTAFFEEESSAALNAALNATSELELDASTGLAVKFGFDVPVADDWYFSGSLYYLSIDTTADIIVNDAVAASVDVDIDPWVLMLGVGVSL